MKKRKTGRHHIKTNPKPHLRKDFTIMLIEHLTLWNKGDITTQFIIELAKVIDFQARKSLCKEITDALDKIIFIDKTENNNKEILRKILKELTEYKKQIKIT